MRYVCVHGLGMSARDVQCCMCVRYVTLHSNLINHRAVLQQLELRDHRKDVAIRGAVHRKPELARTQLQVSELWTLGNWTSDHGL